MRPDEISEGLERPLSPELLARDLTRLAYVAGDGTPRAIPIGFIWNGSQIVRCTAKNAAKGSVASLIGNALLTLLTALAAAFGFNR